MKKITKAQRLSRLRNLRRVMARVAKKPRGAFDHARFGRRYRSAADMVGSYCVARDKELKKDEVPPCATTGCVAGWGGLDPRLRRQGLRFDIDAQQFDVQGEIRDAGEWRSLHPIFARFFGLTDRETARLFYGRDYIEQGETRWFRTAKEAVRAIDALIAKYANSGARS